MFAMLMDPVSHYSASWRRRGIKTLSRALYFTSDSPIVKEIREREPRN
jgi:hypothetical protein